MRVWFAQIASGEPRALEDHDELQWISLADADTALRLPWIPADAPIVRALLEVVASPV
jgi:8-oxo-dGTP diphosphatase